MRSEVRNNNNNDVENTSNHVERVKRDASVEDEWVVDNDYVVCWLLFYISTDWW